MVAKVVRLLAPLALAAVAVGVYLIVHDGLAHSHTTVVHSTPAITTRHNGRRHAHRSKFYVVRSGDSLSTISAKTHVPIDRILSLNPLISPNSLQTGQRLRLRR